MEKRWVWCVGRVGTLYTRNGVLGIQHIHTYPWVDVDVEEWYCT